MPSPSYEKIQTVLKSTPKTWLVTGVAGFIGSNILETLPKLEQNVVGLDNYITGKKSNFEDVRKNVTPSQWENFRFIEGDIRNVKTCREACRGVDIVLHQAALGSVPRSMEDPLQSHDVNVTGFANMIEASRVEKVKRFVYASSSAVYGDHPALPKIESECGNLLSPYALTKAVNESYADVYGRVYGLETIGLRYFNVFGRRQDPEGAYAAVIPKWIATLIKGETVEIYGTGETSRDFCHVDNVVQANLLAGMANAKTSGKVFNIAAGGRTDLNELFEKLKTSLAKHLPHIAKAQVAHRPSREGDILHSLANISEARENLGYEPVLDVDQGLDEAMAWYRNNL